MKFKIGQRVMITHSSFFGITGTIIESNNFGGNTLVKTDEKYHDMLNSQGWKINLYIHSNYLKLLLSTKRIEVE